MAKRTGGPRRAIRTGDYDMPERTPPGFRARQIIVRELDYDPNLPTQEKHFYRPIGRPITYESDVKFREWLFHIAKYGYDPQTPDDPEVHPLDIHVERDSYIVLRLTQRCGPFVRETIQLASNNHLDKYGNLGWVDTRGKIYESWRQGCRVAFFRAKFVDGSPHTQSLTYFPTSRRKRRAPVDPDIRHPGNGLPNADGG